MLRLILCMAVMVWAGTRKRLVESDCAGYLTEAEIIYFYMGFQLRFPSSSIALNN